LCGYDCGEGEDDKLGFFNSESLDQQLVSEAAFALGLEEDHGEMEVGKLVAKLADDAGVKMVSYEDLITLFLKEQVTSIK
jgi:hypothetical protein